MIKMKNKKNTRQFFATSFPFLICSREFLSNITKFSDDFQTDKQNTSKNMHAWSNDTVFFLMHEFSSDCAFWARATTTKFNGTYQKT